MEIQCSVTIAVWNSILPNTNSNNIGFNAEFVKEKRILIIVGDANGKADPSNANVPQNFLHKH